MRLLVLLLVAEFAFATSPPMGEPSLSPNHQEVAFVSGGDIWIAPSIGGEAHLLISSAATESRPLYSPDGTRLAFISTRTGNGDIYVLQLAGRRLETNHFRRHPGPVWMRDRPTANISTSLPTGRMWGE